MKQGGRRAAISVFMVLFALVAGCTKRNPDACCVTQRECEALGFPGAPAPCEDGVCVGLACVASGCDDDGDCAAVDGKPRCVSGQCYGEVEACRDNGGAAIAFSSTRDGALGLYVMYANGQGARRLTDNVTVRDGLAPSPDGSTIAFLGGTSADKTRVFSVRADGTELKQLTDDVQQQARVAWSPDGMWLATSTSPPSDASRAYVIDAAGTHFDLLGAFGVSNFDPSWFPDSSHLVFATRDTASMNVSISVADRDGKNVRVLEQLPYDGNVINSSMSEPRVSPDAMRVAYRSNNVNNQLRVNVRALPDGTPKEIEGTNAVRDIQWSHDGTQLAYVDGSAAAARIWVVGADGSNPRMLISGNDAQHPRWSPDDKSILFQMYYFDGANVEVYRIDADGSNLVNVSNAPGTLRVPSHDYGGEWLACPVD